MDQKIIDCKSTLKTIRDDNLNKLIFAHLNIDSIRNKFEELISQVKGTVDVLMISETKIDNSFSLNRRFKSTLYNRPRFFWWWNHVIR